MSAGHTSDELLDELRAGATKVADGRFSLDLVRALDRLKDHRLAEPSHWVLELLRAATLSGAQRVTVDTDADDVVVSLFGVDFPEEVVKNPLGQALTTGASTDERRARLLGLAIAGALGLGPRWIHLEGAGVRVELVPPRAVTTSRSSARGLRVALRKRVGAGVVAALVRGAPEAAVVRERCRRFDRPLRVNGQRVDQKEPWDEGLEDSLFGRQGELHLRVGLPKRPLDVSAVTLDVLGVAVRTRPLLLPGFQLLAWIRGDGLRTNASGTDVVDTDGQLKAALEHLEALSLELLRRAVTRLRSSPSATLHQRLLDMLVRKDLDPRAREVLAQAPLLPGPSGERLCLAELSAEVLAGRPLHVAYENFPKGTYPYPTLLNHAGWARTFFPEARLVDVEALVRRQRRAVERLHECMAQPVEAANLGGRRFVARESFSDPTLEGEVGLVREGYGAFVRLLNEGRFVQQGDVPTLSPLRLSAVVNLKKPLSLSDWKDLAAGHDRPSQELWGRVFDAIAKAAYAALESRLEKGDVSEPLLAQASDFLLRRVRAGELDVPAPLANAPLFPLIAAGSTSLRELRERPRWHYVLTHWTYPLLSGEPVLALVEPWSHEVLKALGGGRLENVRARLLEEQEVRARLDGPKERARVPDAAVTVDVVGDGLSGQLALPEDASALARAVEVRLLRDGFGLETVKLSARYGPALAAVDFPALVPGSSWRSAERDERYEAVVSAVRAAEDWLALAVTQTYPSLAAMPPGPRAYLLAFLAAATKEPAQGGADSPLPKVAQARVFETSRGPMSFDELRAQAAAASQLWVAPAPLDDELPEDLLVVAVHPTAKDELAAALEVKVTNAEPELRRRRLLDEFRQRPLHRGTLDDGVCLRAEATGDGFSLLAGFEPQTAPGPYLANLELLFEGRRFATEQLPASLPLRAVVKLERADPFNPTPPPALVQELTSALRSAEESILEQALAKPDGKHGRKALLAAVESGFDRLDGPVAQRLSAFPLFACLDGERRSVAELSGKPVAYVSADLPSAPPSSSRPTVVVAKEPAERWALHRWPKAKNLTHELTAELAALAQHRRAEQVAEVRLRVPCFWRRAFRTPSVEGEVGIVSWQEAGCVHVHLDRRPLCIVEGVLPAPLAATVNSSHLTLEPSHRGVVRDQAFGELLEAVLVEAQALAAQVAEEWPGLPKHQREPRLEYAARLALWVRSRAKGHPLAALPLLSATDGTLLGVEELCRAQAERGRVSYAMRAGALLDGEPVWRPRFGELQAAEPLGLTLVDATERLARADRIRARPRVKELRAPSSSRWREAIDEDTVKGELALPEAVTGKLSVQVCTRLVHLETRTKEHPVGAVALVNDDGLRPNDDWTGAARNREFRRMMGAVDRALQRVLVRRLVEGPRDQAWRSFVESALAWRGGKPGDVASALALLPVFSHLDGRPVTLGEVWAEQSREGSVRVASKGRPLAQGVVLADSASTRRLLRLARAKPLDVTAELTREGELAARREARRLSSLEWKGEALVRFGLSGQGLRGELALPVDASLEPQVLMVKEGVHIDAFAAAQLCGARGAVEVADLAVNASWTRSRLAPSQGTALFGAVGELFAQLAAAAPTLEPRLKLAAATHALRYLLGKGVTAPAHLSQLTGAGPALADACLFPTVAGRWVSLRSLADHCQEASVGIIERRLLRPEVDDELLLEASSFEAGWVALLEQALGASRVTRVTDLAAWRALRAEDDPPAGTRLLEGLRRLRKEARLLRAGALGHLTPDDLQGVRLTTAKGPSVRYDAARKTVLLSTAHPGVRRALEEHATRPERLYALLAEVYGVINRAEHHVTDEHEALLLLGLAGYLGANSALLEHQGSQRATPRSEG